MLRYRGLLYNYYPVFCGFWNGVTDLVMTYVQIMYVFKYNQSHCHLLLMNFWGSLISIKHQKMSCFCVVLMSEAIFFSLLWWRVLCASVIPETILSGIIWFVDRVSPVKLVLGKGPEKKQPLWKDTNQETCLPRIGLLGHSPRTSLWEGAWGRVPTCWALAPWALRKEMDPLSCRPITCRRCCRGQEQCGLGSSQV